MSDVKELIEDLKKYTLAIDARLASIDARLAAIDSVIEKMRVYLDKTQCVINRMEKNVAERVRDIEKSFSDVKTKWESWEESLYYIFHNIKKNQFLYSHYPEEWVKNYRDLKAATIHENAYMDNKIAKNDLDKGQSPIPKNDRKIPS